jgi:RNA polymerase sigma factor (sigma-70 family)
MSCRSARNLERFANRRLQAFAAALDLELSKAPCDSSFLYLFERVELDACTDGEPCLLDQLAAPEAEPAHSEAMNGLALEQLVDQLPAAQATALRLTVLEGLSLRQAAERLEISCMSVQRAQKKALAALRQQLGGGG